MDSGCIGRTIRAGRGWGGRRDVEHDMFIVYVKVLKPQTGKHRQGRQRYRDHRVKVQSLQFVYMMAYSIPKMLTPCFHESCGRAAMGGGAVTRNLADARSERHHDHCTNPRCGSL